MNRTEQCCNAAGVVCVLVLNIVRQIIYINYMYVLCSFFLEKNTLVIVLNDCGWSTVF